MTAAVKNRYILLFAAQIAVAALATFVGDVLVFVFGAVVCSAFYASTLVLSKTVFSHLAPVLSAVTVFAISGLWGVALLFAFYAFVGTVLSVCIKKECTRAKTVFYSAMAIAVSAAIGYAFIFAMTVNSFSLGLLGNHLKEDINYTISNYISVFIENLRVQADSAGLTVDITGLTAAMTDMLNTMSFGIAAVAVNLASYISTYFFKLSQKGVENDKLKRLFGNNGWSFVLSKVSAAVFIIMYIFIRVGGETLTLPQSVAFFAVLLAISGGVILMAFNKLRNSIRSTGSYFLPIILLCFGMFFGLDAALFVILGIGLFATFSYKEPKEDSK